jgi:hypothetical protein
LTTFHKTCIFQPTIINPSGGGVNFSSLSGKKPGVRRKLP